MFHVKHPALLYGNMPMQQKSRPLRSGFLYCLRMPEAGYSSISSMDDSSSSSAPSAFAAHFFLPWAAMATAVT